MADLKMDDGLGFLVNRVASEIRAGFDHQLSPYGVTAQQWPILRLAYKLGQPRPSEMADSIGIDRGAVTRLIDRLEEKGLVSRTGDPDDMRAARVELTQKGKDLVPVLAKIAKTRNEEVLGSLNPDERIAVMDYLRRMLDQLKSAN